MGMMMQDFIEKLIKVDVVKLEKQESVSNFITSIAQFANCRKFEAQIFTLIYVDMN